MALVPVNARDGGLDGEDRLRQALHASKAIRTVTVMIHGYRFCPFGDPSQNPHHHILSETPVRDCWKAVSWPRHLRLAKEGALGVALGWSAQGTLSQAYGRAGETGAALARIAQIVAELRPGLRVNVIAHSLGARVALSALPGLRAGAISRLILLSGAEYRGRAAQALASPAGRAVRVLNVTSRENLPFDAGFRALIRPDRWEDLPLSAGMADRHGGWIDLRIDSPDHAARLSRMGFRLHPPSTRFCHWSGYMRPGVFRLYRAMLDDPGGALFARLSDTLATRRGTSRAVPHLATPT